MKDSYKKKKRNIIIYHGNRSGFRIFLGGGEWGFDTLL